MNPTASRWRIRESCNSRPYAPKSTGELYASRSRRGAPAGRRAPAAEWDAVTAALAEPSPEEWYCYDTDNRDTPLAGPQVIEDWSVLTAVLRETAELSESGDGFRYVRVETEDGSPWGQATPIGPDSHLVELSTADGWVEGFEPPQGGGWTTDQAAAALRLWVTRRFRRGDARLTDVPRHPDS